MNWTRWSHPKTQRGYVFLLRFVEASLWKQTWARNWEIYSLHSCLLARKGLILNPMVEVPGQEQFIEDVTWIQWHFPNLEITAGHWSNGLIEKVWKLPSYPGEFIWWYPWHPRMTLMLIKQAFDPTLINKWPWTLKDRSRNLNPNNSTRSTAEWGNSVS